MVEALSRIITEAARTALGTLGLRQKGQSRLWYDDHGWWIINVEFQPSSYARGCYLNLGEQHLFCTDEHFVFEESERLGPPTFVEFDGDKDRFGREMNHYAELAASTTLARRAAHGVGETALRRLAVRDDDLVGGIANALLGNAQRARERLEGRIHPARKAIADAYLRSIHSGSVRELAESRTDAARTALKLPTTRWSWDT